jgi:DNA-binding NarL/FixJ family response regulator
MPNSKQQNPKTPPSPRIYLVDDHPVTREGIVSLLQRAGMTVCGEAESAPAGFEGIINADPDLAIVDISLPTTSGIDLVKNLKSSAPSIPVLVVSMHDEALYAERSLRAGAKGYIMKQEASKMIVAAIQEILNGGIYLSEKIKAKMLHGMLNGKVRETPYTIDHLSDRELEVFRLIGNGHSTRQIAEKLLLSVKTIDSYREHLKFKLGISSGNELVQHAIQWVQSEMKTLTPGL